MSKSIYEEALEDLYYVIPVGYPIDMIGKTIQTKRLLDFIKQAEKKEKLLELYKRAYRNFDYLTIDEFEDLEKQIKELENEINL